MSREQKHQQMSAVQQAWRVCMEAVASGLSDKFSSDAAAAAQALVETFPDYLGGAPKQR